MLFRVPQVRSHQRPRALEEHRFNLDYNDAPRRFLLDREALEQFPVRSGVERGNGKPAKVPQDGGGG